MSQSYSKIAHKADDLTNTDYFKDRVDPWKNWVFTFSARPKKEVSTSFTVTDQSEWKEGAEITSRKTESKVSVDKYDTKTHWTFANDKFALKLERDDILKGDVHLDADVAVESKPAKDEWKVTACAHAHTKDFSGVRAFVNNHVEYNQKKEVLYKQGLNIAHEGKHHLGFYFEHDTKDFKRLWAQLGFTPEGDHSGFLRADLQKHLVSLGHIRKDTKDSCHAVEVTFNAAEGAKGLLGYPVEIKTGDEYKLSDSTHFKTSLRAG